MAITQTQIFEAADRLDAAGVSPTLAAVRKMLGSGSFTTISAAMGEWRRRRFRAAPALSEPVPEPLRQRLDEYAAELWAQAIALADTRLATEREAWAAERQRLELDRQEAMEVADEFTRTLEAAQARIESLVSAMEQSQRENTALQGKLARAGERAAVAEVRSHELEQRVETINAALSILQATHRELVHAVASDRA